MERFSSSTCAATHVAPASTEPSGRLAEDGNRKLRWRKRFNHLSSRRPRSVLGEVCPVAAASITDRRLALDLDAPDVLPSRPHNENLKMSRLIAKGEVGVTCSVGIGSAFVTTSGSEAEELSANGALSAQDGRAVR